MAIAAKNCPVLSPYQQKTLDKAANKIAKLPKNDVLVILLKDYAALRAQVKSCYKTQ